MTLRQHMLILSQDGGQKSEIRLLGNQSHSCLLLSMAILHVLNTNMNRGQFNSDEDQGDRDQVAVERRAEIEVLCFL